MREQPETRACDAGMPALGIEVGVLWGCRERERGAGANRVFARPKPLCLGGPKQRGLGPPKQRGLPKQGCARAPASKESSGSVHMCACVHLYTKVACSTLIAAGTSTGTSLRVCERTVCEGVRRGRGGAERGGGGG